MSLTYPSDLTTERSVIFSAFTPENNVSSVSALGKLATEAGSKISDGGIVTDILKTIENSVSGGLSTLWDNTKNAIDSVFKPFDDATGALSGSDASNYNNSRNFKYDASIVLPMSPSFTEALSHNWTNSNILEATDSIFSAMSNLTNSYVANIAKGLTMAASRNRIRRAVMNDSKILGLQARLSGTRNARLNPGYFANYEGTNFRNFAFKFDFLPQSRDEAKTVLNIIRTFKAYSCARSSDDGTGASTDYMEEPHLWTITIGNSTVNDMLAIGYCVCLNVDVTYGESNELLLFKDGMPKQLSMTVSFLETDLRFEQHFEKEGDGEANRFKVGNMVSYEKINGKVSASQKQAVFGGDSGKDSKKSGDSSSKGINTPSADPNKK